MLHLASPAPPAPASATALEQLRELQDSELRLLAHAIGDHLPAELSERVLELRARQAELVPYL